MTRHDLHLYAIDCIAMARQYRSMTLLASAHKLLNECIRMRREGVR